MPFTARIIHNRHKQVGVLQREKREEFAIYVYTPQYSAIKKSEQSASNSDYATRLVAKTAQAFFDVHVIPVLSKVDLAEQENLQLAKQIFAAKRRCL